MSYDDQARRTATIMGSFGMSPTANDIFNEKRKARDLAKKRRSQRSPNSLIQAESFLADRFYSLITSQFDTGTVISCYVSHDTEPGTLALIERLHHADYRVLVPIIHKSTSEQNDNIDWGWYAGRDDLVEGPLHISRPSAPGIGFAGLAKADLIILSGLLGGLDGSRLGMGAGWYDRALTVARPDVPLWLALFDDEIVDSIPQQQHDQAVNLLVTPQQEIKTTAKKPKNRC